MKHRMFRRKLSIPLICASILVTSLLPVGARAQEQSAAIDWSHLTLEQAFNYALEFNSDVRSVKERLQQQEGLVVEARASRLPKLDLTASVQRVDVGLLPAFGGQTFGVRNSWQSDVTVTQPLFTGFRNSATSERERLRLEAARYEVESTANAVLLAVQETFASILLRRAQLEVQQKSTELLQEELRNEEAKLRAGTVSDFNVLRAKVEVANSLTPLIRSRNELKLAREDLRRVLGLTSEKSADAAIDVEGKLTFVPKIIDLQESIQTALKNRPELRRLKLLVEAEDQGITIAQSGFYPTLSATAGYRLQQSPFGPDLSPDLGVGIDGWVVGGQASWNIFNSFGDKAKVDQARSVKRQAKIALEQANLDAEVDTRRAVSSLSESEQLVKSSQQVVEQAEEGLRRARVRLDSGVGTQLEVLDAQVALTDARSNEVSALYDFVVAAARFDRALGHRPLNSAPVSPDPSK